MTETAVMQTDLDRLSERVERAAAIVQQLREDRMRFERERDEFAGRLQDMEQRLQGQELSMVLQELSALRREQHEWQTERRDVASRIELLLKRLEKIES